MEFKEVGFSQMPAFDVLRSRLMVLRPAYVSVKAGYDFDSEVFRVYVQEPNTVKLRIDINQNLLRDLDQNTHGSESDYTKALISKLDELIEAAIPSRGRS